MLRLGKNKKKAIKWDMEMTEARRTLNWEKHYPVNDPEKAKEIISHSGQHLATMALLCGGACVYNASTTKKYTTSREVTH
ncbi:MAG: phosphomethylpyrimidine synthase ThiC [Candidatus Nitrosocosmicus sp.]